LAIWGTNAQATSRKADCHLFPQALTSSLSGRGKPLDANSMAANPQTNQLVFYEGRMRQVNVTHSFAKFVAAPANGNRTKFPWLGEISISIAAFI
jgi:hypothetical protein